MYYNVKNSENSIDKIYNILETVGPQVVEMVAAETGENVHIMGKGGVIIATTQLTDISLQMDQLAKNFT